MTHVDAANRLGRRIVPHDVDRRPCPSHDVEERGSRGVQAYAIDLDGAARRGRRKGDPERRTRDVARNRQVRGLQTLAALNGNRVPRHREVDAKELQGPFGVIAGRRPFNHGRDVVGLEAGEQHRALHLGARHIGRVADAAQPAAVDRQRRPSVVRGDGGPHPGEGIDHTPHRPARERRVAPNHSSELVRRQDSRQQPHRGSRVQRVERPRGAGEPAQAQSLDRHLSAVCRIRTPRPARQAKVAAQSAPDE